MEIYSKKIDNDILHAVEPEHGVMFEGWGADGVKSILNRLSSQYTTHQHIHIEDIAAFYRKIDHQMYDGDEVWTDLGETEVRNIRFYNDEEMRVYPTLFCFYES